MFLQKFENTSVAEEYLKNGKQFHFIFFVIIFIQNCHSLDFSVSRSTLLQK